MTANVDNLLHLPEVVRNLGPLWAHSCFPFEAANGKLLNSLHAKCRFDCEIVRYVFVCVCLYL